MALVAFSVLGGVASAQETEVDPVDLALSINTVWVLATAFLVFFMQAGFAMVEAGFVRAKNTANILMKNLLDACAGAVIYWAVGFAFAFGSGAAFIGTHGFFMHGLSDEYAGLPTFAFWIFQFAFAATAATIVSGAMAERTRFRAYLFYTVFITAFIYPAVSHWVWGGGWLSDVGDNGFLDFAGSTVVHGTGGWAALMGALILGPRIGKYGPDGRPRAIPGHNMALAALGVFILWFGWYGFNPGSTLGLTGGLADLAARVAVNTTVAAGAGAVLAMTTAWIRYHKPDYGLTMNGTLAGLVGITAPCAFVDPWAAVVIGAIAGIIVVFSVEFFDLIRIDDPVGAISVHAICGVWGTLSVGLFGTESLIGSGTYGLFLGGGAQQLGVQIVGIAAVFAWVTVTSAVLFLAIKYLIGLRASPEEEEQGLDLFEHGLEAYPDFERAPATFGDGAPAPIRGAASTGEVPRTASVPRVSPAGADQPS
jgi:Amt family ammonium transporter